MRAHGTHAARALGLAALVTLVLASPSALAGQERPYSIKGRVDWKTRRILATVSLDARALDLNPPAGRARAEALISWELPELLRSALLGLAVDSRESLGDALASGAFPAEALSSLSASTPPERARFSDDMAAFSAEYSFPLDSVAAPLVRHSRASGPAALLGYEPSRPFSGILIYAEGDLPVHGERSASALRPCLFPRVWTDRMDIVIERNAVSPEAIKRWGPVGYAEDGGAPEERVGDDPMRIMAKAVFGTNRTDLVISRADALGILSEKANRALIAEGRVVIVVGSASLPIGD
jgi:hypothetical protein